MYNYVKTKEKVMFCKVCGKEINDSAVICPHCGCRTTQEIQQVNSTPNGTSAAAVLGFILSLVSLFLSLYCIVPVLGIIFSGVGMSATSRGEKSGKGFAVAGLVISIISLILNIILLILAGSILALIGAM
jgi:hypothetical protein